MRDFQAYFKELKEFIDTKLGQYTTNDEPLLKILQESINYSLYPGGKRIRPILCILTGELFDVPKENLACVACALEMIHTASLIMDDLPCMDDAKLRRGKTANHLVYGEDVASLATFGLLMRAYEVVMDAPELQDNKKTKVVSMLANAAGVNGLVGGQFVDLKFSNKSMEHSILEYIHIHKTAALFLASATTAAVIGDATEDEFRAVETYAKNIGFAFQVLDDLLDVKGKEEKVGKTLNTDEGNFALLYGIDKSEKIIEETTNKAIKAIKLFDGKSDKLIALGQMLLKRES